MSFEDRLRTHLHDKGDAIVPPPTPVSAIERKGARRKRRERVGGAVAAFALLTGGAVLIRNQVAEEPTNEVVAVEPSTTTTESPANAAELTFREVDGPDLSEAQNISHLFATEDGYVALINEFIVQDTPPVAEIIADLPAELQALIPDATFATVDDLVTTMQESSNNEAFFSQVDRDPRLSSIISPPGSISTSIMRSPDGESWEAAGELVSDFDYVQQAAQYAGEFYLLVNHYDENLGTESTSVLRTADFVAISEIRLPAAAPTGASYLKRYTSAYHLAVGAAGIVVGGDIWTDLDVYALIPEEYQQDNYSLNWDENGVEIWRYPDDYFVGDPATDAGLNAPVAEEAAVPPTSVAGGVASGESTQPPDGPDYSVSDSELIESFTWQQLGVEASVVTQYLYGNNTASAIWHAPLDGAFSAQTSLDGSDSFSVVDVVAAGDGFVAVGNSWGDATVNGARSWSSTNGEDWSINSAASASFGTTDVFSAVAVVRDRLIVIGTHEGTAVTWVSTDGGTFWIMHPLDPLAGANVENGFGLEQTTAGDLGVLAIATLWDQSVNDGALPENLPAVEIEQGGFTLRIDLANSVMSLHGADGIAIHDAIGLEALPGSVDGVFDFDTATEDLTFLDPDTGDALITFTQADLEAAVDATIPESAFDSVEPGYAPPPRHLLFSVDGNSWSSTEAAALGLTGDWWAPAVVVGDGEILLAVQDYGDHAFDGTAQPSPTTNMRFFIGTIAS